MLFRSGLQEHLDGLLRTLIECVPSTDKAADIITWRGILTKILCTPFRLNEAWNFNVVQRNVIRLLC